MRLLIVSIFCEEIYSGAITNVYQVPPELYYTPDELERDMEEYINTTRENIERKEFKYIGGDKPRTKTEDYKILSDKIYRYSIFDYIDDRFPEYIAITKQCDILLQDVDECVWYKAVKEVDRDET